MIHCCKDFRREIREIYVVLLIFNEIITENSFSSHTIISTKNINFNHLFLNKIFKHGLIDNMFDSSDGLSNFSADIIIFLIKAMIY